MTSAKRPVSPPHRSRGVRAGVAVLAGVLLGALAPASASAGLIPPLGPWPAPVVGAANPLAGTPYAFNGTNGSPNARFEVWLPSGAKHVTTLTREVGRTTIVRGRLRNRDTHHSMIGATVTLATQSVYSGPWYAVGNFRTNRKGYFRASLATVSHLRLGVLYYPTATSSPPLFSRPLLVRASGHVRLDTPYRKGRSYRFDGNIGGAPLPSTGLLVALQVRNRSGRWVTARLGHTDAGGHVRIRYLFPRGRLTVRLLAPAQTGWTLFGGHSRTRRIHPR